MRRFVMGDIHGNLPALLQCLERSGFDYPHDQLIQLGDITDGHDGVFDCVEELLEIQNLICIKGNHDEWFREFIETGFHPDYWSQGGRATAYSYLKKSGREHLIQKSRTGFKTGLDQNDIPETHRQLFKDQLLYYIDSDNNCFVHGGFMPNLPFENQPPANYYWDRELWYTALDCLIQSGPQRNIDQLYIHTEFKNIFLGHTSTLHWHIDKPMKAGHIYNIDTGAGSNGRLTIMNIDTKEFFQSDPKGELLLVDWLD